MYLLTMDELLCEPNSEFVAHFMRCEKRLPGSNRENVKIKDQNSGIAASCESWNWLSE